MKGNSIRLIQKSGLCLGLIVLFTTKAIAQKELFFTTSAGWKVNYNQLISDKPLPKGLVRHSNWSGPSAAFGLEYKFAPHWEAHFQLKVADIEMGIRPGLIAIYDTVTEKYKTVKGGGETSIIGRGPVYIQIGTTYYKQFIKHEKLSWFFGGGISYSRNRGGFAPDIIVNSLIFDNVLPTYGKSVHTELQEDYIRWGISLNFHTGLDFNFSANHHLTLTLQHNAGLRNIWQYQSKYFYYYDKTPHNLTFENFDVKLRTKGSYSALQLGYKYALTGHKKK